MTATKVKSVGILLVVDLIQGKRAVLVRRGKYNHKKLMGPQTWPGLCQVTAHGGASGREYLGNALLRECGEELGSYIEEMVGDAKKKDGVLIKLSQMSSPKRDNITYGMLVDVYALCSKIQLDPSSGGIELISEKDVENIKSSEEFDPETGVTDLNTIAMFPDEIEAVKQAFIKL